MGRCAFLFVVLSLLVCRFSLAQDTVEVIEYYDTDTVKMKGYTVNGKSHGEWKYYHENGQLRSLVMYDSGTEKERNNYSFEGVQNYRKEYFDGNRFCEWNYFRKTGKVKEQNCYENHQKSDTCRTYYKSGILKQQQVYKDGKLNGEFASYYENGRPEERIMYVNGEQEGYFIRNYYNGNFEVRKNMKNGLMVDSCFYYYPTGQVSASMFFNAEGNMEGEFLYYYRSGQLKSSGYYVGHDNLLDGDYKSFYVDGTKESLGRYDKGEKVGEWKFWNESGELIEKVDYGKKEKSFHIIYKYNADGNIVSKEKVEE